MTWGFPAQCVLFSRRRGEGPLCGWVDRPLVHGPEGGEARGGTSRDGRDCLCKHVSAKIPSCLCAESCLQYLGIRSRSRRSESSMVTISKEGSSPGLGIISECYLYL